MEESASMSINADASNNNSNNEELQNGPIAKKKRRSTAWNHFNIVAGKVNDKDVDFAQCNYCTKKYQYSGKGVNGSTGNLMNHLKNKHPDVQLNAEGSNVQSSTEIVFSQDNYRKALLKWLIERGQSTYEPQHPAFLEVVRTLNPFAETISSSMLMQDLMELYVNKSESVKQKIGQVPGKFSFSIIKKSINSQSFLQIFAHWIQDWKAESDLLDFSHIEDQNSTSLPCDVFVRCLKRYEISFSKVLGVTLENMSENHEFINVLCNPANGSIFFSATNILESLHNIVISSVKALLYQDEENQTQYAITSATKLRNLIVRIRESADCQQEFKEMCTLMGLQLSTLIIDEQPNSTFDMIERAVLLQQPLRAICIKFKTLSEFMISEDEWKELHTLKKLLQKFYRAIDFVPISSYLATVNWLIDCLNAINNEYKDGNFANSIKNCLTKIITYKNEISNSMLPFVATLLNPALKLTYFQEHNYSKTHTKSIEKDAHEIFKTVYEVKGNISTDKSEEDDDELFSHMYKRSKSDRLAKEFQKYLRHPLTSPKSDVLEFWKLNECEFPCLSKMARDYLGVSSSIQISNKKTEQQNESLNPEHIQATNCLGYWLKSDN